MLSRFTTMVVVLCCISCAQRSTRGIPSIPVTADYDRDSLDFAIHYSQEAQQMAQLCEQKAQRPELKRFCTAFSAREQANAEQMRNWLASWYRAKPDPAKQQQEHASEELKRFVGEMRSAAGEKFETEFLSGLRFHLHDGLSHTSECQSRAGHPDYRQFCSTWNKTQEDDRRQLSAWICQWFRDCIEK